MVAPRRVRIPQGFFLLGRQCEYLPGCFLLVSVLFLGGKKRQLGGMKQDTFVIGAPKTEKLLEICFFGIGICDLDFLKL